MTIPLIYVQILCFVALGFVVWDVRRCHIRDKKANEDAMQATRELLEIAKGNDKRAAEARDILLVFYG